MSRHRFWDSGAFPLWVFQTFVLSMIALLVEIRILKLLDTMRWTTKQARVFSGLDHCDALWCEMNYQMGLGFLRVPDCRPWALRALRLYVDPEGLDSLPSDEQTSSSWKKMWVGDPVVGKVRKTLKMNKENHRRIYWVLGFAFLLRDTRTRLATLVAMAHFSVTREGLVREWWFWEVSEAFPTRC